MKKLILLRHAKSCWKNPSLEDHDRPLNERGKRDAPRMGAFLKKKDLIPEYIICSTAKRAKKTAKKIIEACGYDKKCDYLQDIYYDGVEAYISELNKVKDKYYKVMIVGHNPEIEIITERLIGSFERVPTAAAVVIELPVNKWSEVRLGIKAKLVDVHRPREI